MTINLNPYLNFDGNTREAMEFYQSVLGGELNISTFGDFGAPEGVDPNGTMHASLAADNGMLIFASDGAPGQPVTSGSNFSISLSGDDADTLRGYWDGLAEGGQVLMPLERQMWGDDFGMLVDKFGMPWMVNIAGSAG